MKTSSVRGVLFVLLAFGLALGALPILAHHSFAAEYDDTKPVKFSGVVTKVEWMNPHIWFYVDEKTPDGILHHWAFSGGAPGQLMRRGITKDVIQPGMTINVEGFRAKDSSSTMSARSVVTADGKRMFAGSTGNGAPALEGDDQK